MVFQLALENYFSMMDLILVEFLVVEYRMDKADLSQKMEFTMKDKSYRDKLMALAKLLTTLKAILMKEIGNLISHKEKEDKYGQEFHNLKGNLNKD